MRPGTVVPLLLVTALAAQEELPAPGESPPSAWRELFNGKDLDGWVAKISGHELGDNFADTFRVEDGVLQVRYDGYGEDFQGRFGHLFFRTPFSSYRLLVEYRFVGEQMAGGPEWARRNSGVMLHCQPPGSMRKDQSFPVSIEVQLLGGEGTGERPTANLCTPGTHVVMDGELVTRHCTDSTSRTFHGEQWVTVEVEVHGYGTIRHRVEGRTVLTYEQPQLDETDPDARELLGAGEKMLSGGYLALQSESHPVEFRRVAIQELEGE